MGEQCLAMSDWNSEDFTDDSLFQTGEIFARRELLRVGHVPDQDRIVGREKEMRSIGNALAPATQGGPPRNVILYGKTGTGKSLVSRHVTQRAKKQAQGNEVNLASAYVDCSDSDTETRVARELTLTVRDTVSPGDDIPRSGIGSSEYYSYLWNYLDNLDSFIAILDEIDQLDDDNILMQLSRAEEAGKTDCYIGVISISNKIEYRDRLNERIDSSLQDSEHVFHPYDANQLREILENRSDAFVEGVLEEDVIPKAAALAAKEHGDARKAIEILYEAGAVAESEGHETVSVEHLDDAQTKAEVNRFQELVSGSTPHVGHILHALALLTASNPDEEMFSTHDVYQLYCEIVEQQNTEPLKQDSVYRLLKEQTFLGVTESRHTGDGRGQGSYLEHRLMRDPEIVMEALGVVPEDTDH